MRLIDADALVVGLLSLTYIGCDGGYYKGIADERDATLQRIKDAPTVESPVKTGEWLEFETAAYNDLDECGETRRG